MDIWGATQCTTLAFNAEGKGLVTNDFGIESIVQDIEYIIDEAKQTIEICFEFECVEFAIVDDRLLQIMDEDNCLCEFEYDKKD